MLCEATFDHYSKELPENANIGFFFAIIVLIFPKPQCHSDR